MLTTDRRQPKQPTTKKQAAKFDQRPPWLFGSCLTTTEREVYTALYWLTSG